MAMVGVAQGYQPLVSYYYGQKRMEQCQKLKKYGIAAAAVLSVVYTAACMIFAESNCVLIRIRRYAGACE